MCPSCTSPFQNASFVCVRRIMHRGRYGCDSNLFICNSRAIRALLALLNSHRIFALARLNGLIRSMCSRLMPRRYASQPAREEKRSGSSCEPPHHMRFHLYTFFRPVIPALLPSHSWLCECVCLYIYIVLGGFSLLSIYAKREII